jgi:hypothetical protein
MWQIVYLGKPPVFILYNRTSALNNVEDFAYNIQSVLTKYRANEYIESMMSLNLLLDTPAPNVSCTIANLLMEQVTVPVYDGKFMTYPASCSKAKNHVP